MSQAQDEIAQLREELEQARAELDRLRQPNNPDPRAEALLEAGLSKAALPDALALFQVERNGPMFKFDGHSSQNLAPLARHFLRERPHFQAGEPGSDEPSDSAPRYADGRLVPVNEMLTDELWDSAERGPAPTPEPQAARETNPRTHTTKELAAMSSDELWDLSRGRGPRSDRPGPRLARRKGSPPGERAIR